MQGHSFLVPRHNIVYLKKNGSDHCALAYFYCAMAQSQKKKIVKSHSPNTFTFLNFSFPNFNTPTLSFFSLKPKLPLLPNPYNKTQILHSLQIQPLLDNPTIFPYKLFGNFKNFFAIWEFWSSHKNNSSTLNEIPFMLDFLFLSCVFQVSGIVNYLKSMIRKNIFWALMN